MYLMMPSLGRAVRGLSDLFIYLDHATYIHRSFVGFVLLWSLSRVRTSNHNEYGLRA